MLLKDRVCVIVGAGSLRGIGYAAAELFAEHGAKIVAVDVVMNDGVASEIKASIDRKIGRSLRWGRLPGEQRRNCQG
jgi:NAD(P)-dependent dehydrogenase (short-subunit alcohol dehydrogenase family)